MPRSVEYQASSLGVFVLARIRLEQALADPSGTAAPKEPIGADPSLPPAVVLEVDGTILANSGYEAGMIGKDATVDPKTWTAYVNSVSSLADCRRRRLLRDAEARGVKLFDVSNPTVEEEEGTTMNLERLGLPRGGAVDTVRSDPKPLDWGSAHGTRRADVVGDQLSDLVGDYRGTEAERLKVMVEHKDRWGRERIRLSTPSYGAFESEPFTPDFKLSEADQRTAKRAVREAWPGAPDRRAPHGPARWSLA